MDIEETWAEEHKDMWATKAWREMRDVDAIEAERNKYKKALEDLKDWVEEQEGVWSMDIGLGNDGAGETPYFAVLKKIEELIENK